MKTTLIFLFACLLAFGFKPVNGQDLIQITPDIQLLKISDGFYIHQSYTNSEQYGRFSSNGLLVIKNGKALMIDTPVTNEETKTISDFLKDSLGVKLTTFIGGHSHSDCIGGMGYLNNRGVRTILNSKTKQICIEQHLPLPVETFDNELKLKFENIDVECRYFGGGHSVDNIVVYFPGQQILFGGCLIKTMQSRNLGNTADAVISEWDNTVQKVIDAYPDCKLVVPGHGNYGSSKLLTHTIDLVKAHKVQH